MGGNSSPKRQRRDKSDYGRASRHYTYENTSAPTVIADFGYTFDDNSNITDISFDHRDSSPDNGYEYDGLNRLARAEYLGVATDDEEFTMDDLGNRISVLRDTTYETYAVNDDTNRYDADGTFDISCAYDNAGNMTSDHRGYNYAYDYENRIMKIDDGTYNIVAYSYDALGRRFKVQSFDAGVADYYEVCYHNAKWQVLYKDCVWSPTASLGQIFIEGNYIDEHLAFIWDTASKPIKYYVHDHLFSTVALLDGDGDVIERSEYDAYGKMTKLDPDFTPWSPNYTWGNCYYFTGREVDSLDGGDLSIMYYRNRYYDPEVGRFLTEDPLGVVPNGGTVQNVFSTLLQYTDGLSLYEYVQGRVLASVDPMGLDLVYPGYPGPGKNPRKPKPPMSQCEKDGICGNVEENYNKCLGQVSDWDEGCTSRGAIICAAVCIWGENKPACLVCIGGYDFACKKQKRRLISTVMQ